MIPNFPTPTLPSHSFESRHDDSKVDPSPSPPISSPSPSTSPSESFKSSNEEAKKKKKLDKQEANRASITPNAPPINKTSDPSWKVKFPCKLCKGDHLFRDYPGIPSVLEVWSQNLDRPSPSTYGDHVDATSSVSDGKKKGKIRFLLCYVKESIFFTFVLLWIKLPKFWRT